MNQVSVEPAGAARGSFKSYITGFILSIALTTVAFGLVMSVAFPRPVVLPGILGAAVVQMLVHLHYFLHLNTSSASRWNLMALILTILIMILFVGGTLWIMYHLNQRLI